MKKAKSISFTDKRIIILFIISTVIAILTSLILYLGETFHIIIGILLVTIAYCGWIVSLSLVGILIIGMIELIKNNRKK